MNRRRAARRFLLDTLLAPLWIVFPVGRLLMPRLAPLASDERRDHGWTILLPGIMTRGLLEYNIARGLARGGVKSAIEIVDWTTGWIPLFLYHVRSIERNRRQAAAIVARIVDYQDRYPGRPVHLVGYSGGAGIALMVLEALPADRKISGAILLAAAVSPDYPLGPALRKTERGLWNFFSPWDWLVGALTLFGGTLDGRHVISAGTIGFDHDAKDDPPLRQVGYRASMLRELHLGGHFGWSSRPFVAKHVAPIIGEAED